MGIRSTSYEDFMSFDHYKIDQSQNQGENNTIIPKLISTKKQKYLMTPKNHFQEKYWYYDSIKNINPLSRDLQTQFYNKEKLNKVETYFKTLEMIHTFFYMMRNLSVRDKTFFHKQIFLLIGSYCMIVITKNSETLYTPMGITYTRLDIFMIQNIDLSKVL